MLVQVETSVNHANTGIKSLCQDAQFEKMENWLSPPNVSTNLKKALEQRQKGTGLWLLKIEVFVDWTIRHNSFLWLFGNPGCGKTILSATVIDHLQSITSNHALLYFYFDFNNNTKQSLEAMVVSFISQLYLQQGDTRGVVDQLASSHKSRGLRPSCETLCETLARMLEKTTEVWIVIDALDECVTRKGPKDQGVLAWIRNLLASEQGRTHLLVTSRPEGDIQEGFSWATAEQKMSIQSDLISADISTYVHEKVKGDSGLERWRSREDIQDEIEATLIEKADGM